MSLLSFMKQSLRPKTAHPPATKFSQAGPMIAWSGVGQPRWTNRRYDAFAEEGFRKNVIAYRCVTQISIAAATIPWLLYDDEGHELDRHPLLGLLQHPNPLQDGVSFLESVYAYLQIAGNAYIEAVRPQPGASPIELYVLRPDRMKVVPGPMGLPQGYQYSVNGQVTNWPADPVTGASNILHLRSFHPLDDWYGLAPMEAALLSIDQHNAAGAWNQALLNQGARPAGALVYAPKDGPNTLSDDQMQRLREELGQLYQGSRNAGRPMILEGGLDWREMSLSPKDMDWLAGRNNAARDIAQAFGVPAQLIGIPDSQTYSNMAEARMAFYEETVLPLVTRTIAGFDHWLTPMFDEHLQLDYDPDQISALTPRRDAQWSKLNNARFLTRNEQRKAAGYGPVPGGDTVVGDPGDDDGDDDGDPDPAGFGPDFDPDGEAVATPLTTPWLPAKFNPHHDELGRFTTGPSSGDDKKPANGNATGGPAAAPVEIPKPAQPAGDKPGSGPGIFGLPQQPETAMPVSDKPSLPVQPAKDFSTSQQGVSFIAQHETFGANEYHDDAGHLTIGYGHELESGESYPNGITREEAQQLLANDIGTAETAVQNDVKVPLTQPQFDALTSLAYNIGIGHFGTSTLLQLLNQGDYNAAADQFLAWNKITIDGMLQPDSGLTNRRNAERNLFLNGSYQ